MRIQAHPDSLIRNLVFGGLIVAGWLAVCLGCSEITTPGRDADFHGEIIELGTDLGSHFLWIPCCSPRFG